VNIASVPPVCRFANMQGELYGVQTQNNFTNYRMLPDGTWYVMGLTIGIAPAVSLITPGGPYLPTGTRTYVYTFLDSLGRESSPSPVSSGLAYAATLNHAGSIDLSGTSFTTSNVKGVVSANIYASTGGSVYYLIGNITFAAGAPWTFTDNFADATVNAGAICPNFGQNDPPLPGSVICLHKNHIFMNVTNDSNSLQCSNFGSATQFSTTGLLVDINGQVTNPNDGVIFKISSEQGNDITGLCSHGTLLIIGRQRSIWALFGDSIVDFTPRRISSKGNVSPDAMVDCDGTVIFCSQDGVYGIREGNLDPVKLSGGIDDVFQALMADPTKRGYLDTAVALFVQRHYILCFGVNPSSKQYAYNVDTGKWVQLILTTGTILCAAVARPPGSPELAFIGYGAGSSGANRVAVVDLISGRDNVTGPPAGVATTNMSYRTRPMGTSLPYHLRSEVGEQEFRAAKKRLHRTKVYGLGASVTGNITCTCDGRTETYPISNSNTNEQLLCLQEWTAAMTGYCIDVTLSGWAGTGVEVTDINQEYDYIG